MLWCLSCYDVGKTHGPGFQGCLQERTLRQLPRHSSELGLAVAILAAIPLPADALPVFAHCWTSPMPAPQEFAAASGFDIAALLGWVGPASQHTRTWGHAVPILRAKPGIANALATRAGCRPSGATAEEKLAGSARVGGLAQAVCTRVLFLLLLAVRHGLVFGALITNRASGRLDLFLVEAFIAGAGGISRTPLRCRAFRQLRVWLHIVHKEGKVVSVQQGRFRILRCQALTSDSPVGYAAIRAGSFKANVVPQGHPVMRAFVYQSLHLLG
mmetsp:Transcript_21041/g.49390  ORF Transcript_21041/g.49390 Transcript_21041/m.49390 type:complete len:271 (-) Transcript_21041:1221-2033(-)